MPRSKRRKIVERQIYPDRIDLPEDGMPEFEVVVAELSSILVRITVTNLNTGQTAITSAGPDSDHEELIDDLKKRLYHR